MVNNTRPRCSFCSETARVWHSVLGLICKFSDENGFCKEDGKICPKCNKLVERLKPMMFFGGPMVCFNCRDEEWRDVI